VRSAIFRPWPQPAGSWWPFHIGALHQRFTDQETLGPGGNHALDVGGAVDAAFAHQLAVGGDQRGQPFGGAQIGLHDLEIAVVDADQLRFQLQRPLQLGFIVHLDQHVHAVTERDIFHVRHFGIGKRRDDQQDAIGAQGPGFDDLIGIDHEILADHRQIDGGAGLAQMGVGALEELVGQDRQAGGAGAGVGAGQLRRLEGLADQPGGGRGLLDFGDQADADFVGLLVERGGETARRRLILGTAQQFLDRALGFGVRHFLALFVADAVEDGAGAHVISRGW
jgi:hypothetical protein